MTIWKYEISLTNVTTLDMPIGAELLTIQSQYDQPCMWAIVDPDAEKETRVFRMYGTGHPMMDAPGINHEFVGTFQMRGGSLVFHVFELTGDGVVITKQTARLN